MKRVLFSHPITSLVFLWIIIAAAGCGNGDTPEIKDIKADRLQSLSKLGREIMAEFKEIDEKLDANSDNDEEFQTWQNKFYELIDEKEPLLNAEIKKAGGKIEVPFDQTGGEDFVLIDEVSLTEAYINQKFIRIRFDVRGIAQTDLGKEEYKVSLHFVNPDGEKIEGGGHMDIKPVEYKENDNVLFRGSFDGLEKLTAAANAVVSVNKIN